MREIFRRLDVLIETRKQRDDLKMIIDTLTDEKGWTSGIGSIQDHEVLHRGKTFLRSPDGKMTIWPLISSDDYTKAVVTLDGSMASTTVHGSDMLELFQRAVDRGHDCLAIMDRLAKMMREFGFTKPTMECPEIVEYSFKDHAGRISKVIFQLQLLKTFVHRHDDVMWEEIGIEELPYELSRMGWTDDPKD